MKEELHNVKFENQVNPNSTFDIIRLEKLFKRKDLEFDPAQLHKVGFFMLLFVTEGEGSHTIDFTEYKYKRGSLLTVRKDQIHKFFRSDSPKGYLLLFTDDFLVSYLEKLEVEKTLQLFNELLGSPKLQLSKVDFLIIKQIVDRIKEEYLEIGDEYSLAIIRSELNILITKLFRIKSKDNQTFVDRKYLSEFIEFQKLVESNASKTTRVNDYASLMNVSTKTLNNISRSVVNKAAKQFIDEVCTKQIKRLLINTNLTIKEVAYASGFAETTNFYKYFKRQVNMTPEHFRSNF